MINIDISSQGVSYTGGTFSPTVIYENTTYGGVVQPVCPNWITLEYVGGDQEGDDYVESYRFSVASNDGGVRNGTITFECTDVSGNTFNNYINVTQGSGEIVEAPIWKDTYFFANHYNVFSYSIKNADGVNVYFGKAYCAPGDGGPYVQVNKICQNYLRQNLGDFRSLDDDVVENVGAYADFSLCGVNEFDPDSASVELMNYRFLFDWAGDWAGEGEYAMTEPINGHLNPRMWLMYTEYNSEETDVDYEISVPYNIEFSCTPTSISVPNPGGVSYTLSVTCSDSWRVVAPSWVIVTPSYAGSGTTEVSVKVLANTVTSARSGSLQFKHNAIDLGSVSLSQVAAANNKIYYTSTNGQVVTPTTTAQTAYRANYISNTYSNGVGVILFDGNVELIGTNVFAGKTTLKTVTIPNTVWGIGTSAFSGCRNLEEVVLPTGLTTSQATAYANCSALTQFQATAPTALTATNSTFSGVGTGGTLYYPAGADYSNWSTILGNYNWVSIPV